MLLQILPVETDLLPFLLPDLADVPLVIKQSTGQLAAQFVKDSRHAFDGWPGGVHYIEDLHETRLNKLRPILPARLATLGRYTLWGYITKAVNDARARERASYQSRVDAVLAETEDE